jgi:vitamin B12 transporter
MMLPLLLFSAQAVSSDSGASEIVITASRVPQEQSESAASTSVIDQEKIERLGEPLASSFLRLTPSAAVETGGPAGALTQVRIRGAEANHTLLFIDGIRANDPAAGDIPRFELLNADIVSRLEVVRGPQSALWGADAIGGVVAVNGIPAQAPGYGVSAEGGSFGFGRAGVSAAMVSDRANLAGAVGWQRATGIDSFDGEGDKDGYRNLSARVRGSWNVAPGFEAGVSGFALTGRSQFDGFDPITFRRADTLDSTRNRLAAGRLWVTGGDQENGPSATVATSLLGSSNRNYLAIDEINRTTGQRWTVNGQFQHRFSTGVVRNTAIVALEHDREDFHARDVVYGGASNQDRRRNHQAVTAEWRAELAPVIADLAIRHDVFSSFKNATTVRASALAGFGGGFSAAVSYSEGIAQPTFFDLYGFFPGTFVGNPSLKPESSHGFEASLRYRRGPLEVALTAYRQQLRDEIVDVFDPDTFLSSTVNRERASLRRGAEAEIAWRIADRFRLVANYAHLHATEPAGDLPLQLREIRRPRHSGSMALDGRFRELSYGASLAYVGARIDTNFDVFPAERVRLKPYWLGGVRAAYAVRPAFELFARASNLFDVGYQDVFGYCTEGRAIYAGLRIGGPRSVFGRIGDHRGEVCLGHHLALDQCSPCELANRRSLLHEFDLEPEEHARFDRSPELRALDRHEIDQLAGARQVERFNGEHPGGLRQRLDDQHTRHDGPARKVALEELLVDRHRLDGDDPLRRVEALNPVDEE